MGSELLNQLFYTLRLLVSFVSCDVVGDCFGPRRDAAQAQKAKGGPAWVCQAAFQLLGTFT